MTWKDKYDIVNYTFDGDVGLFGDHYTKEQCEKFLKEEGITKKDCNIKKLDYIWIKFGFIRNDDGEVSQGWKILEKKPNYKQGVIKATLVN